MTLNGLNLCEYSSFGFIKLNMNSELFNYIMKCNIFAFLEKCLKPWLKQQFFCISFLLSENTLFTILCLHKKFRCYSWIRKRALPTIKIVSDAFCTLISYILSKTKTFHVNILFSFPFHSYAESVSINAFFLAHLCYCRDHQHSNVLSSVSL